MTLLTRKNFIGAMIATGTATYTSPFAGRKRWYRGMLHMYSLRPDDLYVRARVESDRPSKGAKRIGHVKTRAAWTQPYRH